MPLRDHFHPPLSLQRPWDGIHSAWATAIATRLNRGLLPDEYFALPQVTVGGRVEIDVATLRQGDRTSDDHGGVATATWAPPRAGLAAAIDFTRLDTYEVRVMQQLGGPRLRAAVELVSPANKDRASHRRAFVVKCAAYLQRGVSVVIVDIVTERLANLHEELVQLLRLGELSWTPEGDLYAVAYRTAAVGESDQLELWPTSLAVATPLPTLPLWLEPGLAVPLDLEETYETTCDAMRVRP